MADPVGIEIQIRARNEASESLQKVQGDFEQAAKTVTQRSAEVANQTELTSHGLRNLTQTAKLTAGAIAGELNPAFGQMVFAMSAASREGQKFSLATSAMLIGITAAGVGIAAFIQTIRGSVEAQVDLNRAMAQFDAAGLRVKVADVSRQIEILNALQDRALEKTAAAAKSGFFEGVFSGLLFTVEKLRQLFVGTEEQLKTFQAAADKVAPFERQQLLNQSLVKQIDLRLQLAKIEAGRALEIEDLDRFNFETGRQTILLGQQAEALEATARAQAKIKLGQPGLTAEGRKTVLLEFDETVKAIQLAERLAERANFLQIEQGRLALATARGLRLAAEAEGAPPTGGASREAREIALREDLLTAQLIRTEEEKRAEILTHRVGLTQDEQDVLQQNLILVRQRVLEEDSSLTVEQRRTKELQLQIEQANLTFERTARTDPLAGLTAGFRDLADEFQSTGAILRTGILDLGHDLSRAFSDSFFLPLTGDFKKLAQLPQQFALSLVRTVTDALGKLAVGSLLRNLGLAAFVPGLPGFGGTAGGAIAITSAAQAQQFAQSGFQIVNTSQSTVAIPSGGAAAAGGGLAVPPVPLSLLPQPGFVSSFLQTPLFPAAGGAGLLTAEGAAVTPSLLAQGIAEQQILTPALTLGQGLSVAGGALGLGLTIFTALQGPPTPLNVVTSAASGALSGALIGSAFPGPGTVIGAIAGGILGGGAALFGKGGGKKKIPASIRSQQEGETAAASFIQAVDKVQSLDELVDLMNRQGSPFPGQFRVESHGPGFDIMNLGGTPFAPTWRKWTVADLFNPIVIANLKIFAGALGSPSPRPDLEDRLRQKITSLTQSLSAAVIGFQESLDMPGAVPSVTRTTIIPFSERAQTAGQAIFVLENSILGMSDSAKAALFQELARVAKNLDITRILLDEDARVPVTVGTVMVPA